MEHDEHEGGTSRRQVLRAGAIGTLWVAPAMVALDVTAAHADPASGPDVTNTGGGTRAAAPAQSPSSLAFTGSAGTTAAGAGVALVAAGATAAYVAHRAARGPGDEPALAADPPADAD